MVMKSRLRRSWRISGLDWHGNEAAMQPKRAIITQASDATLCCCCSGLKLSYAERVVT